MPNNDFRYYLRVRYGECDAQQVVFNARYGDYVGLAIAEFLRAVGCHGELNQGALGTQYVRQAIEWKAPARFDQVLELSARLVKIGTTSFTVHTEIRIAGGERIIVTAETVLVLIDEREMAKRPLPDRLRAALTGGAPGRWTDHAGYLSPAATGAAVHAGQGGCR